MLYYILNTILWTLAFFGVIELIKEIVNSKMKEKENYIMLLVKNEEDSIEGVIRKIILKIKSDKIQDVKKIIIIDLGSKDKTNEILKMLELDYDIIKIVDFNEYEKFYKKV